MITGAAPSAVQGPIALSVCSRRVRPIPSRHTFTVDLFTMRVPSASTRVVSVTPSPEYGALVTVLPSIAPSKETNWKDLVCIAAPGGTAAVKNTSGGGAWANARAPLKTATRYFIFCFSLKNMDCVTAQIELLVPLRPRLQGHLPARSGWPPRDCMADRNESSPPEERG